MSPRAKPVPFSQHHGEKTAIIRQDEADFRIIGLAEANFHAAGNERATYRRHIVEVSRS